MQRKYSGASQFRVVVSKSEKTQIVYFLRFLSGRCVNAEAATLFTLFEVLLLRNNLEAVLPTLFEVLSLRPIFNTPLVKIFVNNLSAPRTNTRRTVSPLQAIEGHIDPFVSYVPTVGF